MSNDRDEETPLGEEIASQLDSLWSNIKQVRASLYAKHLLGTSSAQFIRESAIDPSSLRSRYGVDVEQCEFAPYIPPEHNTPKEKTAYERLPENVRRDFYHTLSHLTTPKAANQLQTYLREWKDSSRPRQSTQSYEQLVKDTIKVDAPIRQLSNESVEARQSTGAERAAFAHWCRLSHGLLDRHYDGIVRIHRGVRKGPAGMLFAQALDNPSRDTYYLEPSVISNFSVIPQVGADYSDGVVVRWEVAVDDIVAAVDQLRLDNIPSEGEVHVTGGVYCIPSDCVMFTGPPTNADGFTQSTREDRLNWIANRMNTPRRFPPVVHREIADFVEVMALNEVRVGTSDGADRLQTWYDEANSSGILSSLPDENYEMYVEYTSQPDQSAFWNEY